MSSRLRRPAEVLEGAFRPQVTDAGRRHPVTRGLPGGEGEAPTWGRWFRLVDSEPAAGDVVMSGREDKPLLVLSRARRRPRGPASLRPRLAVGARL